VTWQLLREAECRLWNLGAQLPRSTISIEDTTMTGFRDPSTPVDSGADLRCHQDLSLPVTEAGKPYQHQSR